MVGQRLLPNASDSGTTTRTTKRRIWSCVSFGVAPLHHLRYPSLISCPRYLQYMGSCVGKLAHRHLIYSSKYLPRQTTYTTSQSSAVIRISSTPVSPSSAQCLCLPAIHFTVLPTIPVILIISHSNQPAEQIPANIKGSNGNLISHSIVFKQMVILSSSIH